MKSPSTLLAGLIEITNAHRSSRAESRDYLAFGRSVPPRLRSGRLVIGVTSISANPVGLNGTGEAGRSDIFNAVWGDAVGDTHTVDNFVSSLEKKLKVESAGFELKTVRGVGFRLVK